MPNWQDFLAALGGFGSGASQAIGARGRENEEMEFRAGQQERLFGQQERLQTRGFEHATGLETMREAGRTAREAQRGTVPIGGLPSVFRQEFQTPPPESELMRHTIEEPGRPGTQPIPRPQVREPERVDERILGPLGAILGKREEAARAESDPMRTLTLMLLGKQLESQAAGGGLAPGTDITLGGQKNLPRITQRGPLREAVALGPESRFLQSHTQHFMSAEGGSLPRIQAEQQARALWNDEQYRTKWMAGAGTAAGGASVQLGPASAVMPGGPIPPQPGRGGAALTGGVSIPQAPGGTVAQAKARETATGTTAGENVEGNVREWVAAGGNTLRILQQMEQDPRIEKYAWTGRRAAEEGREVVSGLTMGAVKPSQDYTEYRQVIRNLALQAFDFGGKQLTQTEKAFVQAAVPSGNERTPQELRAKLRELRDRIQYLTGAWSRLATVPRGQFQATVDAELGKFSARGPSVPSGPGTGRVPPPGKPPGRGGGLRWRNGQWVSE